MIAREGLDKEIETIEEVIDEINSNITLVANEISQLDSETPGCIWYHAQDQEYSPAQMTEYKKITEDALV